MTTVNRNAKRISKFSRSRPMKRKTPPRANSGITYDIGSPNGSRRNLPTSMTIPITSNPCFIKSTPVSPVIDIPKENFYNSHLNDSLFKLKGYYRNRYRAKRCTPLTLVIGMHYDKGAIIVSDSRIMEATDYRTEQKLFYVTDKIVLSSSGLSDVLRQLIETLQSTPNISSMGFRDLRRLIESQQKNLWYWYKGSDRPTFNEDQTLLQAIIGSNTDGKPKLLILHENGYTEEITTFKAIGDGSRHANNILRNLYRLDINKERALQIGIHALIQTASIDAVVDNRPQVAVIENGNCKILNYDETNSKFSIEMPELLDIKNKINGIAEKQTTIFELMLDGSEELKQEFLKLLERYKSSLK